MSTITWISPTLARAPLRIGLCTSDAAFRRETRRLRINNPGPWLGPGAAGSTHYYANSSGDELVIVCVDGRYTRRAVDAVIVHEAMHVWRHVRELIGESEPSKEFEAYAMQNISRHLFDAFDEQRKKKRVAR